MSDSGQFALPPDVRALVDVDRHASEPPVAMRERMARQLEHRLGLGALALGTSISAVSAMSASAASAASVAAPASGTVAGHAVAVSATRLLMWKLAAGAGIAAAVGGGIWPLVSGHRAHDGRAVPVAAVSSVPVAPQVRDIPVPAAEPTSAVAEVVQRDVRPRSVAQPLAGGGDRLVEERTVLDGARRALARRDGVSALQVINKHDRLFPRGQLVQERESMRVQALVLSGDYRAARGAGERFRRNYPHSVLLSVIDRSLEGLP